MFTVPAHPRTVNITYIPLHTFLERDTCLATFTEIFTVRKLPVFMTPAGLYNV
jgi:hypothetical protein